jgi:hypothetical protein
MFAQYPSLLNHLTNKTILVLILLLSHICTSNSQPAIRIVEGTNINLDTLYEGHAAVRELTVENAGRDTLNIENVRTSCGCTVAKLASKHIPPGGSEKLTVTFESKDAQGQFKREVYINSNDTSHPEMDITIRGTILTVIEVFPRYISFGTQKVHRLSQQVVRLKNTVNDTIRILSCGSPDSQLHLRLADSVITPGRSVNLEVELSPTKKGNLLGQLELATSSPLKPVVKISYMGTIK